MAPIVTAAVSAMVVNLPFGFWRAGVKKFSARWFAAVHLPIVFVAGIRIVSGLGWHLATLPILAAAFFAGQYVGGTIRRRTT